VLPRYVVYATPGKKEDENTDVIAQPIQVNQDTFNQLIFRTKEIIADKSFSAYLGYSEKRTVNQCLKEADTWQKQNPDTEDVMAPYKKFVKVIPILNKTAKAIVDAKKLAEANEEEKEEEESGSDTMEQDEEDTEMMTMEENVDEGYFPTEGDGRLLAELRKLREQNKKLVTENAYLQKKVQWLEVLSVNNGGINPHQHRKWRNNKQNTNNPNNKIVVNNKNQ